MKLMKDRDEFCVFFTQEEFAILHKSLVETHEDFWGDDILELKEKVEDLRRQINAENK